MKSTLMTFLSLFLVIAAWSNNGQDKKLRCEVLMKPYSKSQSFEKRVAQDLVNGLWEHNTGDEIRLYQFDQEGSGSLLSDNQGDLSYQKLGWSVMQIGEVVYLRLDGGEVEYDHLYTIKQNCEGIILKHAQSGDITYLDFLGAANNTDMISRLNDLKGQWFGTNDINGTQIRLYDDNQYDLIYNDRIESGYWQLFPEGHYIVLNKDYEDDFRVIKIKHLDFMSMDIHFGRTMDPQGKIYTLEKRELF